MLDIFGACSLRCKFNIHFQDLCLSACEKQNIFALKYTNCTETSNDLNCTDTKHPLISVHFLDFTHILLTCTMVRTRDEPCWGRQDNSKSIQIHTHTHFSYYQVKYVESNWSELIYVVTASERYNLLWVSNNLSPKKVIGREIEGSSSLQRNFT